MVTEASSVSLFLSWSHQDLALKDDLVQRLTPSLSILRGVRIGWWEDSHLLLGDDFRSAIVSELGGCDYGLLLLSPSYMASSFVATYELPRFTGLAADKGALPVALRPLPLDGSRELRGIEQQMIFRYRGKAFAELTGSGRDGFASELATQIRRRVLRDREGICEV
jgi:TIR domain